MGDISRLLLIDGTLLDISARVIRRDGEPDVRLEPLECGLLGYLGRFPGRRIAHDELDQAVWGLPAPTSERQVVRQRQRIKKCVRKLREKIEPEPSAPIYLVTGSGGYLLDPTGGRYGGSLPAAPGDNNNLRAPGDRFFGRRRELAELEHLVRQGGPVVLRGPGGIGKSRLALHVALALSAEFTPEGGAWFCELRECRTRDDVHNLLIEVLPTPPIRGTTPDAVADTLKTVLCGLGRALVVMDNLEQLDEQALEDLNAWAAAATEVHFIWTCRFQLPGALKTLVLPALPPVEALPLFLDRAPRSVKPGDAAAVVERLGGLPLAIELAAAGCRFSSLADLRAALEREGGALGQRLLEVVVWSWALLEPLEREALRQCAVFRGRFDLQAFTEVVDVSSEPTLLLQALEDRSLLQVQRSAGEVALFISAEVRQYASARFREGVPEVVEDRHRDHYLARSRALYSRARAGDPGALRALEAFSLELRAVYERYLHRQPEVAGEVAMNLASLWLFRGPLNAGVAQLSAVLDGDGALSSALRMRLLAERGAALRLQRLVGMARDDLEASLALAHELGEDAGICTALSSLGMLNLQGGDLQAAHDLLQEGLERGRRAGLWMSVGRCCAALMVLENVRGGSLEAERYYLMGLEAARRAGDLACSRRLLGNLALLRRRQGRLDEAEQAHREELKLHRELGDLRALANAQANLGALLLDRGDLEAAEEALCDAQGLQERLGNHSYAAVIRGNRGLAALERGELKGAAELLRSALHEHEVLGDRRRSKDLLDLVLLAIVEGREDLARQRVARCREAGVPARVEGYLLALEALLASDPGEPLDRALEILEGAGDPAGAALVQLIRKGPPGPSPPPPSVYFRVVCALLSSDARPP